ncbi:iron-sulfur cluster assembly scaffold protein [Porphyrobacter sp. YT40]|uniref:iron-sulfur cluster assembly scaffold protein n=1 Tax=Porphyrobacter sp. YT40 TaxID=2547601 RepID=UPI001143DC70|nr:iron-sulfur cluster assembly scaffold protein [Porphyrobacter sp. YT40]QDH34869.1 iron-sulfur cluster assembly scaffold protein [Porphyrobacter sp. YT40]
MSARVSTKLYSPELLGLATGLAAFPLTDDLPLRAEERSRTCGSVIVLGLALDDAGCVSAVGMNISACAIGQASAAVLAQGITGSNPGHVRLTATAIERWLAGEGELPRWSGIAALAPARDHPGRHGALLLPWKAASAALSQAAA